MSLSTAALRKNEVDRKEYDAGPRPAFFYSQVTLCLFLRSCIISTRQEVEYDMEGLIPIEAALVKNAQKRHAGEIGRYVVVIPETGDSFVGKDYKEASQKAAYYYDYPVDYESALTGRYGRRIIGFNVNLPKFSSVLDYVCFQAAQVRWKKRYRGELF
jgi:hypothetical protein